MIYEDHYKKNETVELWEAMDADGSVFLYPIKPVWSEHFEQWKCPFTDQEIPTSTVRLDKHSKGLTVMNSPLRRVLPYEEYLRLLNKYR